LREQQHTDPEVSAYTKTRSQQLVHDTLQSAMAYVKVKSRRTKGIQMEKPFVYGSVAVALPPKPGVVEKWHKCVCSLEASGSFLAA